MEMAMKVIFDANDHLVFDEKGRVCLCDPEGNMIFTETYMLPQEFLDEYAEEIHKNGNSTMGDSDNNAVGGSCSGRVACDLDVPLIESEATVDLTGLAHSPPLTNQLRPIYLWTDNATKFLISAYKDRKQLFFDKSVKKAALWKEITQQLTLNGFGNPSPAQVEDKFKNLRRTYAKIKDTMGPNSSGAPAPGRFRYYDEINEIFSKNPQFDPPLLIGSRRPRYNVDDDGDNNEEEKIIPKKRKSNMMEQILQSQNERFGEILKEIKISRETFADKLDKLIDKL